MKIQIFGIRKANEHENIELHLKTDYEGYKKIQSLVEEINGDKSKKSLSFKHKNDDSLQERPKSISDLRKLISIKTAPNHGLVALFKRMRG